jgi:hypothetical protein
MIKKDSETDRLLIELPAGRALFLLLQRVSSLFTLTIGAVVLMFIALAITGHSDIAVQIIQIIVNKFLRVLQALLS